MTHNHNLDKRIQTTTKADELSDHANPTITGPLSTPLILVDSINPPKWRTKREKLSICMSSFPPLPKPLSAEWVYISNL